MIKVYTEKLIFLCVTKRLSQTRCGSYTSQGSIPRPRELRVNKKYNKHKTVLIFSTLHQENIEMHKLENSISLYVTKLLVTKFSIIIITNYLHNT